jgi:hypothetical protein
LSSTDSDLPEWVNASRNTVRRVQKSKGFMPAAP